jgi:hypothetical protein
MGTGAARTLSAQESMTILYVVAAMLTKKVLLVPVLSGEHGMERQEYANKNRDAKNRCNLQLLNLSTSMYLC